jgi:hypothetical protein
MIRNYVLFPSFVLLCLFKSFSGIGQSPEDTDIYEKTMEQICDRLGTAPGKDSLEKRSYCYRDVLVKNYLELKKYGVDTLADPAFKSYYPLYLKRFRNVEEKEISKTKDESFSGQFSEQKKLPGGQIRDRPLFKNGKQVPGIC